MKIAEVIRFLESIAPLSLQEPYDNAGLLTGNSDWECRGILCTLDATEAVVEEALSKNCNLIVAHHPIIFQGLKKINGKNYVERTVIAAIKKDIALYAIHTNLDNVIEGVNGRIAALLKLKNLAVLGPKDGILKKLYTYVPNANLEKVRNALFAAGGGNIGNYTECSFNAEGTGTYKPGEGTHPHLGKIGERHLENEVKVEVILPAYLEGKIIAALKEAHPYEEVAYEVIQILNTYSGIGSGLVGEFEEAVDEKDLLTLLKKVFNTGVIRHTRFLGRKIRKLAVCGGAGSFLIGKALAAGADAYVTADLKYHEFFEANDRLILADIGHFESEQFTINLLQEVLAQKFLNFAVLKTEVETNPVLYF